jgi:hypothetical protein
MPLTHQGFTRHNDLQEIEWRNKGETGGGIMKNEMPSLLLDEKICFTIDKAHG